MPGAGLEAPPRSTRLLLEKRLKCNRESQVPVAPEKGAARGGEKSGRVIGITLIK